MAKMAASANMCIGGFALDWDEWASRELLPCVMCGEPTRGRYTAGDGAPKTGAACLTCAMKTAIAEGMKR